jgi:hypothetical protein
MLNYVLITGALFLGCVGASALGLNSLGAALFPIPVVVYLARRRVNRALGLIGCAAAAALVSVGTFGATVYYALIAATGIPLGIGMVRRWSYGWTVTATVVFAYVVALGSIGFAWEQWLRESQLTYDALIAEIQHQAPQPDDVNAAALVGNVTWLKGHWAEIGLGTMLWPLLVEVCIGLSLVSVWLRRRFGVTGVRGSFRAMRASEWLIWAVIAVAALVFLDRQWPGTVLHVVSWNTAVALAAVYWLNGFSIVLYALDVLRPHALIYLPLGVVLVWFGIHPVLCCVGLFDTWADFRKMLDGVVAARRRRESSDDDGSG